MTLFSGRNNCFYPIDNVSRRYDGVQHETTSLDTGEFYKKLSFNLGQVYDMCICDGNCLGLLLWTRVNISHPYVSLWHRCPSSDTGRRDDALYIL